MISTTSAIHHILALGGVDSSQIIGSYSDTKSTLLDQRSAATTNDAIAMEEEDDTQRQNKNQPIIFFAKAKANLIYLSNFYI